MNPGPRKEISVFEGCRSCEMEEDEVYNAVIGYGLITPFNEIVAVRMWGCPTLDNKATWLFYGYDEKRRPISRGYRCYWEIDNKDTILKSIESLKSLLYTFAEKCCTKNVRPEDLALKLHNQLPEDYKQRRKEWVLENSFITLNIN